LLALAWQDVGLCALADALHRSQDLLLGATTHLMTTTPKVSTPAARGDVVQLAVCGAHMSGLPLNHQLIERGGRLVQCCRTAPLYHLFALPGGPPLRPGLVKYEGGRSIELEIWELPTAVFGSFLAGIPPPLTIGTIEIEDGTQVKGFLCEARAAAEARDITEFGGWRQYLATQFAG
jgi:allophanate hydrolase